MKRLFQIVKFTNFVLLPCLPDWQVGHKAFKFVDHGA
nr:MAG TPA: hypothetical protein [Caudoviricetes sp.]